MTIAVASPVVFVMRVYDEDIENTGDKIWIPYVMSFTIIMVEGIATIEGFSPSEKLTPKHKRAIFEELKRIGAHTVRWLRVKDDTKKEVRFNLNKP